MRAFALAAAAASLIFGAATLMPHALPATLQVPGEYATIQQAIDLAPEWAVIRVAAGTYRESLEIAKPLSLIGSADGVTRIEGAADGAVVRVRDTRGARLERITVAGGEYGIVVDESVGVRIEGVRVLGAHFVGIRLSRAHATIARSEVRAGVGPYGMGIELANTHSRPPSLIRDTLVAGSTQEGIVLHNAHARLERNTVVGNGLRGIAITEMSMATVVGNTILDNADAGVHVVDMSMAEIEGNHIAGVRPGPEGKANGIRAFFYAEVMLGRNRIEVPEERAVVSSFSSTIEDLHRRD